MTLICRHDLETLASRYAMRDCLISELICLLQVLRSFRSRISDISHNQQLILELLLDKVEYEATIELHQALYEAGNMNIPDQ